MSKKIQQLDVSVLGQNWRIDLTDYIEQLAIQEELNRCIWVEDGILHIDEDIAVIDNSIFKISTAFARIEGDKLILNI